MTQDDRGYYYFVDRVGDTFRWNGENVSTFELEDVFMKECPYCEIVVYGVRVTGYEGRCGMMAISIVTPPKESTESSIQYIVQILSEFVKSNLASYARPVFIRFIKCIDKTGTMKVMKGTYKKQGISEELLTESINAKSKIQNQVELIQKYFASHFGDRLKSEIRQIRLECEVIYIDTSDCKNGVDFNSVKNLPPVDRYNGINKFDALLHIFTSGTTGLPKMAKITHYRFVQFTSRSNSKQVAAAIKRAVAAINDRATTTINDRTATTKTINLPLQLRPRCRFTTIKDRTAAAVNDRIIAVTNVFAATAMNNRVAAAIIDRTTAATNDRLAAAVNDRAAAAINDRTAASTNDLPADAINDRASDATHDRLTAATKDLSADAKNDRAAYATQDSLASAICDSTIAARSRKHVRPQFSHCFIRGCSGSGLPPSFDSYQEIVSDRFDIVVSSTNYRFEQSMWTMFLANRVRVVRFLLGGCGCYRGHNMKSSDVIYNSLPHNGWLVVSKLRVALREYCRNGLRKWTKFVKRFSQIKLIEFYGSTEGNCYLFYAREVIGSCGFNSIIFPYFLHSILVKTDEDCQQPLRNYVGYCIKCLYGVTGMLISPISKSVWRRFDGYNNENDSNQKIITNVLKPNDMYFVTDNYNKTGLYIIGKRTNCIVLL
ncbi:hypothetical protein GJ496_010175 [Pomphorhynchus laevis]|nr:hypothetical protein GJ496_010175 [Pomphorhynchus laevis]